MMIAPLLTPGWQRGVARLYENPIETLLLGLHIIGGKPNATTFALAMGFFLTLRGTLRPCCLDSENHDARSTSSLLKRQNSGS